MKQVAIHSPPFYNLPSLHHQLTDTEASSNRIYVWECTPADRLSTCFLKTRSARITASQQLYGLKLCQVTWLCGMSWKASRCLVAWVTAWSWDIRLKPCNRTDRRMNEKWIGRNAKIQICQRGYTHNMINIRLLESQSDRHQRGRCRMALSQRHNPKQSHRFAT